MDAKIRITVLRRTLNEKLAQEFGDSPWHPCEMVADGQIFISEHARHAGRILFVGLGRHSQDSPDACPGWRFSRGQAGGICNLLYRRVPAGIIQG